MYHKIIEALTSEIESRWGIKHGENLLAWVGVILICNFISIGAAPKRPSADENRDAAVVSGLFQLNGQLRAQERQQAWEQRQENTDRSQFRTDIRDGTAAGIRQAGERAETEDRIKNGQATSSDFEKYYNDR